MPCGAHGEVMALSDAVKPARDGAFVDVSVLPGAPKARFPESFDAWRHRVKAKVQAPPRDGQANAELLDLARAFFDADVTLVTGNTQPRKRLWVGLPPERVVKRLAEAGLSD